MSRNKKNINRKYILKKSKDFFRFYLMLIENPHLPAKDGGLISLGRKRKNQVKMGRVGFEPTANALKGHCSTTELPTRK